MLAQLEFGHADGVAVEGIRRNDVGAGFEIGTVNVFNELGLREGHHLGAVLERDGVVAEAGAAVILFLGLVRVDHRTHGAVEDEDAAGEEILQKVAVDDVCGDCHEGADSCKNRRAGGGRACPRMESPCCLIVYGLSQRGADGDEKSRPLNPLSGRPSVGLYRIRAGQRPRPEPWPTVRA